MGRRTYPRPISNGMKSFYWIIAIIVVFVVFLGAAAWYKNQSSTSGPIPGIEITSSDHIRGNGPVVLVEYSDFQCPACRAYFPLIEELLKQKGADITFVYRHFPLPQHANAYPSAQAAEAAGRQGKFFEMYQRIFEGQDTWAELSPPKAFGVFKGYAQDIGLDMQKFESDYNLKEARGRIQNDYKSGVKLGVNATPTFFLNGQKVDNPRDPDDFIKAIEAAKGAAPTPQ